MYRIYLDGDVPVYVAGSSKFIVSSPRLQLEVNKAGTLTFTVPPDNPSYNKFHRFRQDIYVKSDDVEIWRGRIIAITSDWLNQKTIEAEGELAYLCDTIQRQKRYNEPSVASLFNKYVTEHNGWIYADRQFVVGQCTVTSNETSIFRFTNYNTTMQEIREDLLDNYGGYLRVRHENGNRYLDYLESYDHEAPQAIEFSKNLLDLVADWDGINLFTRIIPLGATLEESQRTWRAVEGLEEYLTIRSVNGGDDWLDAPQSIKDYFGVVTTVMKWDDVHDASILKTKAQAVLDKIDWDEVTIEVKAIDLHLTDKTVEEFRLGDTVQVNSKPHNQHVKMMLSKLDIRMDSPSQTIFTLGISNAKGIASMLGGASK